MCPEQQAACALALQDRAQLIPGDLKLRRGSRVAKLVEPREFQQDIEAADKCARRSDFCV